MNQLDVQTTPPESSTAAPASSPAPAFSGIEVDSSDLNWRKTGNVTPKEVKQEPPTKTETSAPSKPSLETPSAEEIDDEFEDSETAPESDPGKQVSGEKRPHKGTPANVRIKQLLDRIKALESKQAPPTPAESSPAKPVETKPAPTLEKPVRPKLKDFDGSPGKTAEDYDAALEKYEDQLSDLNRKIAVAEYRQEQARQENDRKFASKLTEAETRYSDFNVEKINGTSGKIMADEKMPLFVKAAIGKSEVLPDLMYVLAGDQQKLDELISLSHSDPVAAMKYLARMEVAIEQELSKAGTKTKTESGKSEVKADAEAEQTDVTRNDKGQFQSGKAPENKKAVTNAPPIPREVSGKGTSPPDEVQSAFEADGDDIGIDHYRAAANRRDLARRKG